MPCLGCCFRLRFERKSVRPAHLYCALDNYIFVKLGHGALRINEEGINKSFSHIWELRKIANDVKINISHIVLGSTAIASNHQILHTNSQNYLKPIK